MENKKLVGFSLVIFAFFLIPVFCSQHVSATAFNISDEANNTATAIENAKADMREMIETGFNVARVNDTILECEQLYDAQLALEEKTGKAEYDEIMKKIETVGEIKKNAFLAYDELKALNESLSGKIKKSADVNFTEGIALFKQAQQEFYDERYEQCLGLVEKTYDKMAEAEAEASRARAFYRATTATIGNFFKNNWEIITSAIVILAVAYLILRNRLAILKIKRKIKRLELEKQVLYSLIKQAQKDYFEKGDLSEANYRIKTKKFSELIRDIDRQLPLLMEELEKKKTRKKAPVR